MSQDESHSEQRRRSWVRRLESFKDRSEDYDRAMAEATDPTLHQRLMEEFGAYRTAHRREDIEAGRRPAGMAILMRQRMWARWLEIAVEHESSAKQSFRRIVANPNSGERIPSEFKDSLVAVTAAAYCIEALFGELKYLIDPVEVRRPTRSRILARAFRNALGLEARDYARLQQELAWLFDLRNYVVHAYTEEEPPLLHPAGINTAADASRFNAVTSGRAIDVAMLVLRYAEAPTTTSGRWVDRWVVGAQPYHETVVRPLREQRQLDQLELPSDRRAAAK